MKDSMSEELRGAIRTAKYFMDEKGDPSCGTDWELVLENFPDVHRAFRNWEYSRRVLGYVIDHLEEEG